MSKSIREHATAIVEINEPRIRKAFQIAEWGEPKWNEEREGKCCYRGLQILGIETGTPADRADKWFAGADTAPNNADWHEASLNSDVDWPAVVETINEQHPISERYDQIDGTKFFDVRRQIVKSVQAKVNQSDGDLETVVGEVEIVQNKILIPLIYIEGVSENISIADVARHFEGISGKEHINTSLLHEIAHEAAYAFSRTLYRTDRGVDTIDLSADTLIRKASSSLLGQVSQRLASVDLVWSGKDLKGKGVYNPSLFGQISVLSRQTYEGDETRGCIVFTHPDLGGAQKWNAGAATLAAEPRPGSDEGFDVESYNESEEYVSFDVDGGVGHSKTDGLRKLLETAQNPLALLSDGKEVYGLKSFPDEQRVSRQIPERFFNIVFHGGPNWELRKGEQPIMVVSQDGPRIPKPDVESDTFRERVDYVFGNDADAEELWRVVEIAKDQLHGTMVVISEQAAGESDRLSGESTPIQAQRLESEYVMGVTAIDGALMMKPDGTVTAIGVILDGQSDSKAAMAAKGARHNAAYRYRKLMADRSNGGTRCLLVIVSEDGPVSFCAHPELPDHLRSTV